MNSVTIFYGSQSEFKKRIPETDDYRNLSSLTYEFDNESKLLKIVTPEYGDNSEDKKIEVQNFVISSSEYAGVNNHVITNFGNFLSKFDVENLFIHNPPKQMEEQVFNLFPDTKIEKQDYNSVNLEHLTNLNKDFSKSIVGQENAKLELLQALFPLTRENRTKPVVILLYGKSGVGKTETAKYLAKLLNENIFRKQFSMFQNEQFANYLFGGTFQDNSFAKDLLDRESNILLLDEFDKANPIFHSAFYQLFDEGIFEDRNYSVELQKSVIICTSNYTDLRDIEEKLGSAIYNRFDKIIKFKDLDTKAKQEIGSREFDKIESQMGCELPSDVKSRLEQSYLKQENVRQIQRLIENTFALYLINSEISNKTE
ncbi:AAA family ATPase [Streptococcus sobrinus]|uniref:AAA family ATPase n=2 Tax=Streptococcus sobrinus TaxID=1310 RepID=UPI00031B57B4|nr:AAA family ATPase [Streptococcus sobrinus]